MNAAADNPFVQFGELVQPADAQAPILTPPVRQALFQWLAEMNARADLERVGIEPRQRALLAGPPGCGKTTLAHHICTRIGIPMLVVQSHRIVSSYLGATGQNIGKLFQTLAKCSDEVALFFDEFDSLAKSRSSGSSGVKDERDNITVALLQEFDRYDGLLFAATNARDIIDAAVWRRFNMQIEIGLPGADERFAIVRLYLAPFAADDETIAALAAQLADAAPSLIKEVCEHIKRQLVLGPRLKMDMDAASVILRVAASCAPASGQPVPPLWHAPKTAVRALQAVPWPPRLDGATA